MTFIIVLIGILNFFMKLKKYQITNPTHISSDTNSIKKVFSNYSLTEGINQKMYNKVISEVLSNLPDLDEWLSDRILKKFNFFNNRNYAYLRSFFN